MAFSSSHLYFDDVEIGQEWESSGRTITEADVVNFAGVSGDFNPIHMDHEYAKRTPFRRPIAHGMLGFAVASGLGVSCPPMRTIAFVQVREWNLREPIFIGDTVHLKSKVMDKTLRGRGRRGEIVWYRAVINQDGKIVQEGVLVTLCEGRGLRKSAEDVIETVTEPALTSPLVAPEANAAIS
jgi:3-hydroxybutyryl-CoA dehydratase